MNINFHSPKVILAPMDGLTDPLMREILTSIGQYDWTVSEFIRITQTVLPKHVFYKYVPELQHDGIQKGKTLYGTPVHIQLLGSHPTLMAENAVKACELGALAIDLNFGCPAKTVNHHRGGAVLLTEPNTIYQIVSQVRQAVATDIPVSAKIRLGYQDTSHTQEICDAIQSANASWLTIHARTKTQGYKPPAYWEKIAPLTQKLHIPIIANGEIWTLEHALQCQIQANTPHLMLGRGAVTRPDLSNQIQHHHQQLNNNKLQNLTLDWQKLLNLQIQFLQGKAKSDHMLIGRYKQWLGMLTQSHPQAMLLWQKIKPLKQLTEILKTIQTN